MRLSKIKVLIPGPESAFTVDLDNEHVSWPVDSGGNTTEELECYTVPRAYYGARNVIDECTIALISTNDPDITIDTTAFKTTGIRIWVDEDIWFDEFHEIVFRITHPTYGSREVTFWLTFVRAGANGQAAVLYELLPNLSVISFARQAEGSLTPASRGLTISIKKTTGGRSEIKTISETGLTVRYSTSAMPTSKTGGLEFPSTLTINSSATFSNVYIAAFNSAGTLVDRETIPVIKDGDSSVVYWITSSVPSIAADENGHPVNPNEAIEVKEWKRVGNNPGTASSDLKMTCYTVKDGVETAFGQSNWAPTANFTSAAADEKDSICIKLYDASNNIVRTLSIPVEKKGDKGDKGDDGVTYEILPSVAHIRADKDGNILTGVIEVSAYKIKGENRRSCGVGLAIAAIGGEIPAHYWVQYRINGGSWTSCSNISIGSGMYAQIGYGVPASAVSTITSGIAFRLCYGTGSSSYSVVHEMAALQVVKDGQTGARGKTGRYYYYDGYFNNAKEYMATDHQAPYIAFDWTDTVTVNGVDTSVVKTSYYMLVADTNKPGSTYIAPRTTAASGIWELMETSFKFLIAQAFFTEFGKLGSAVFSGDWMISQHGTPGRTISSSEKSVLNGIVVTRNVALSTLAGLKNADGTYKTSNSTYTSLKNYYSDSQLQTAIDHAVWAVDNDVTHEQLQAMSSTSYQLFGVDEDNPFKLFTPNYAVDFLAGQAYLEDASLRGVLKVKALYTVEGSVTTVSGTLMIDLEDSPGNSYVLPGNTTVYLPDPTPYAGLSLTILFSAGSVLAFEAGMYMAYYTGTTSVVQNGMSFKAVHSAEGLSVLTLQAIKAYGPNSGVKWVVVGQRGILGVRSYVSGADAYQVLPDGRLLTSS